MKNLLVVVLIITVLCLVIKYGNIPEEYIAYPEKSGANVMLYNDSTHGSAETSGLVFTLQTSFRVCDKVGAVQINKNGNIGVCTATGWVVH